MAEIRVIGSGEAFDAGLGNTAYLFSGASFPSVLFDCGYQIPERLWAKDLHRDLNAVCFTHLHADHAFGIVPLLVRYWEEKRRAPLHILAPSGTSTYVRKLCQLGYPGMLKRFEFPIIYHELSPTKKVAWKKLRFSVARSQHSVLNFTVRVDLAGASFAVSGDGQITAETKALVEDVDLLLQEVYTLGPEIPTHGDLQTVAAFVAQSKIGRVGIAHQARAQESEVHAEARRLGKRDRRWLILKPELRIPLN